MRLPLRGPCGFGRLCSGAGKQVGSSPQVAPLGSVGGGVQCAFWLSRVLRVASLPVVLFDPWNRFQMFPKESALRPWNRFQSSVTGTTRGCQPYLFRGVPDDEFVREEGSSLAVCALAGHSFEEYSESDSAHFVGRLADCGQLRDAHFRLG